MRNAIYRELSRQCGYPDRMELTAARIRNCLAILVLVATIARPSLGDEAKPVAPDARQSEERTTFQTHAVWSPRINLNGDVAITYGIDPSLPSRIDTWRKRGYRVHVMTGVAWGDYADYVTGRWDGKKLECGIHIQPNPTL